MYVSLFVDEFLFPASPYQLKVKGHTTREKKPRLESKTPTQDYSTLSMGMDMMATGSDDSYVKSADKSSIIDFSGLAAIILSKFIYWTCEKSII
jgi:hypothetical protein